ncbi:MAG: YbgC/FadM family acyl-CoA thioesterase [Pseudomonadota bacterium]|nr:YbgC/FadM family acyl-CoA thioesterase [Pseudomonadota bacterium]
MKKIYLYSVNIFYEDTDSTGFVYHTNYIKFAERARSNLLREQFPDVQKLLNSNDYFFVVSKLTTNFFKPAKLGDNLKVETFFLKQTFCSIKLKHKILNKSELTTEIDVKLVWINGNTAKPTKIPENIIARFNSLEVV